MQRQKRRRLNTLPLELKLETVRYLSIVNKARLSLCSRDWHNITVPELYRLHANKAIEKIVLYSTNNVHGCNALDKAVSFGGNVNASIQYPEGHTTALHIAAALNKTRLVSRLLELGANVAAESIGLSEWLEDDLESCFKHLKRIKTDAWVRSVDNQDMLWLPLLIPMLKQYHRTASLLLQHQAPAYLWKSARSDDEEESEEEVHNEMLTVLHLAASYPDPWADRGKMTMKRKAEQEQEQQLIPKELRPKQLVRSFIHAIHARHPVSGDTALTMAMRYEHHTLTQALLDNGADVNTRTFNGTAPLLIAADKACLVFEGTSGNWYMGQLQQLLNLGANAAIFNERSELSTPIMAAIASTMWEWGRRIPNGREVVRTLVEAGALVNTPAAVVGKTAVHLLVLDILNLNTRTIPKDAIIFLREMVKDYRADINMPLPDDHSVLWKAIRRLDHVPFAKGLVKLLIRLGAKFQPTEVEWKFYDRIRNKCEVGESVLLKQKHLVSQHAIDDAYYMVYGDKSQKSTYEWLKHHFPRMTNGNKLLARWIKYQGARFGPEQLRLPIDANYIDKSRRSFLHMIVTRFTEDEEHSDGTPRDRPRYTEKHAVQDVQTLIDRGMSVCIQDRMGRTGLHRLRLAEHPHKDLEYLLMRQKDIELGQLLQDRPVEEVNEEEPESS